MVNLLFGVAPHRVIDMAAVVRLVWIEDAVKPVIHIQDWGTAPPRPAWIIVRLRGKALLSG
jgi:hypothetical protein